MYDNENSLSRNIIKFGYQSLLNFDVLRNSFIKQAMGENLKPARIINYHWNVLRSKIELIVLILSFKFGDSKIACLSILLKGASIANVDNSCKLDVSENSIFVNF